ncbi:facilitated trehalose transporter Tret1 [Halyomorpha halys]|uniref:facilitated trehalose transporter Tret1 n=1 Tax=Halyomorpha halys TaxID=286706 RepID=UPI0006D4CE60|nr:facilitated trehalose transporter Tret1-like [Halyomorpha halys]
MKRDRIGKWRQFLAAILANLSAFCVGTMLGWTSPMQPLLESDPPPVGSIPMTREEISWIGSINFIGAIAGTFIWGRISDRIGRKTTALIVGLPFAFGWTIILFSWNHVMLYIGRVVIGLGCSGAIINTPMYVTEIAEDSIRGSLGSFLMMSINTGCLFCYIIGSFTSFHTLTTICLSIPIIYIASFAWFPESPVFLYTKGLKEKAHNSLQWYRGGDPLQTEKELNLLEGRSKKKVGYRTLIQSRGTIKGLLIGFGFVFGQQFCGILAILTYTVTIFKESGSALTPHASAIIVGSLQLVSSLLSFALVDKAGRRILLGTSYAAMALALITLGVYFKFSIPYPWIPVTSLSLHVIAYSFGAGPVPFIVMAEIFPPQIRGLAMSVIQLLGTSLSFASVKLFPSLVLLLGQSGCFFFYGGCCLVLIFFTLLAVPETKGRTLQSIINRLNGDSGDETTDMVSGNNIVIMPKKELEPIK